MDNIFNLLNLSPYIFFWSFIWFLLINLLSLILFIKYFSCIAHLCFFMFVFYTTIVFLMNVVMYCGIDRHRNDQDAAGITDPNSHDDR